MKVKSNYILLIALLLIVFTIPDFALAGPGGFIAKGIFKTWYGKLLAILLFIILFPLIIYIRWRESIEVKKNKRILNKLSIKNKDFDYLKLDKFVRNIFIRVHHAWMHEKMDEVSNYVTNWYWQNQQMVYLEEWERNGLKNICKVKSIGNIKPLFINIPSDSSLEGAQIAYSITANMEDYLVERSTGKVVQGRKGYADEERIWIFEYENGEWKLDDIREGGLSLAFAKMKNIVPQAHLQKA